MSKQLVQQLYGHAFAHGRSVQVGGEAFKFSVVRAGMLLLPTGRVVLCDPLVGTNREPFVQAVLPGRYPVDLAVARRSSEKAGYAALARVLFTARPPVVWVNALRPGEATEELPPGTPVVSGTAAYMDAGTASRFGELSLDMLDDILERMAGNFQPSHSWLEHAVDERHNVILFSAGRGEGRYPSYLAIDEGGDACVLVTYFDLWGA